jgi:hypothetical protein
VAAPADDSRVFWSCQRCGIVTLAVATLLAALSITPASAASPYPLDLRSAVQNAYAPHGAIIRQTCDVFYGNPVREAALVVVSVLPTGRTDEAGFVFVNTAGWLVVWKGHAATGGVPNVSSLMQRLQRTCSSGWSRWR